QKALARGRSSFHQVTPPFHEDNRRGLRARPTTGSRRELKCFGPNATNRASPSSLRPEQGTQKSASGACSGATRRRSVLGWTIRKIVVCAHRARLRGLDKSSH